MTISTTVPYRHHATLARAETSLNYWVDERKMPPSKVVLDLPAYWASLQVVCK